MKKGIEAATGNKATARFFFQFPPISLRLEGVEKIELTIFEAKLEWKTFGWWAKMACESLKTDSVDIYNTNKPEIHENPWIFRSSRRQRRPNGCCCNELWASLLPAGRMAIMCRLCGTPIFIENWYCTICTIWRSKTRLHKGHGRTVCRNIRYKCMFALISMLRPLFEPNACRSLSSSFVRRVCFSSFGSVTQLVIWDLKAVFFPVCPVGFPLRLVFCTNANNGA